MRKSPSSKREQQKNSGRYYCYLGRGVAVVRLLACRWKVPRFKSSRHQNLSGQQCHYNLTGVGGKERYRTSSTVWQHTEIEIWNLSRSSPTSGYKLGLILIWPTFMLKLNWVKKSESSEEDWKWWKGRPIYLDLAYYLWLFSH